MVTIAASEIVRYMALNLNELTGGPAGTIALLGPTQLASYNGEWQEVQGWAQSILAGISGGGVSPTRP